jgi:hypothetical protein
MDTGYHDADPFSVSTNMTYLEPAEVVWHQDKLANAGGRKNVLFSHHQLFTAFDGVGDNAAGKPSGINTALQAAFQPYGDKITAWFWGHEHNLEIYEPYLGLARGRCAGASAIPLLESQHPYDVNTALDFGGGVAPTLVAAAHPLAPNADHTYAHAFVMLSLGKSGAGEATYYQIDSAFHGTPTPLYQESF